MSQNSNALANETSPYLVQHSDNPVQWFPWGEEALALARSENKPIFLSIGYSACHWCHVMAHESFEDEPTAKLMNSLFVNIKVDREERPDLDKIYQLAHQLLTQRPGGWPLTMFLTPDTHEPFYAGTYFPIEPRYGMPSFRQVLTQIEETFRTRNDDIIRQNKALTEALKNLEPSGGETSAITGTPLLEVRVQLGKAFDEVDGGFGRAPKFPHCTHMERLLRHYAHSQHGSEPDREALEMAAFTLKKMSLGGLYDQLGGGYSRYSVDDSWMIPHFEKMLYDNGPLLVLCCEVGLITGETLYLKVARETADWVTREMQAEHGGYYSTIDADSEGVEGKYYVWGPGEVEDLLNADEFQVVATRFGLNREPNFEHEYWHLHVFVDDDQLATETGFAPEQVANLLASARQKLFVARETRIRPGLDDKILTSWNGLMIKGMAVAGRVLQDESLIDSAFRALDYVRETMWVDGRLLATSRDGRAKLAAYLDDYAFMIDGVLSLLQSRWRDGDLEFAIALADVLLEQFEDTREGGFFFTAHEHEALMHQHKPLSDDAVPAGNGIAAQMLGRLGHLLGETRYLDAVERTLHLAWNGISNAPHAFNTLLLAVEEYLYPVQTIVLRGEGGNLLHWQRRCLQAYAPRRMAFAIPPVAAPLPGLLEQRKPLDETVAYVCEGHTCGAPISNLSELSTLLETSEVLRG
jgi:uncharacterized protein YyaL (SSP411 family)